MLTPRKPMPSFTLILTSGHRPLIPTTVQLNSSTMLPTASDYLMRTIDLRDDPKDVLGDVCDEDSDAKTVFEAETPANFNCGAEQNSNNSIKKNLSLLIRRFISHKWNFINNGPPAVLKTSLN